MKEDLLIKFLNGACTPEEIEQIKKWIRENEPDEAVEALLASRWQKSRYTETLDQHHHDLLASIHQKLGIDDKKPADKPYKSNASRIYTTPLYARIAASVLIVACALFALHYFTDNEPTSATITAAERIVKRTSIGEKLTVVLPDSSVVTLNSSSSLEYPSFFSDSLRAVKLLGEAFFEVAHEAARPFTVSAGQTETTVLGTKFNINNKDQIVKVALAEGKVKVAVKHTTNSAILSPGQMASSDKAIHTIAVQNVNIEELIAWKDGIILFKSASLGEVFNNLETWYGVKITVDNNIDLKKTVSGEFNNENLQDILSGLSFSLRFQFSLSDNEVRIYKK